MMNGGDHSSSNYHHQRQINQQGGIVHLDVGGKMYRTAQSTLVSNSSYFRSLFSSAWSKEGQNEVVGNNALFVDQDPEPFETLLSFMRLGCVHCKDLNEKVLLQAEFFGIDKLIDAVKCIAYFNINPEFSGTDEEAIIKFTQEYHNIKNAVTSGVLPTYLSRHNHGHKEYANLHIIDPNDGDFLDRNSYGDLVAALFVPRHFVDTNTIVDDSTARCEEEARSNEPPPPPPRRAAAATTNMLFNDTHQVYLRSVPNCPTFLDALNWLSRHGFTKMEAQMDRRRENTEIGLSLVVDFTFSREVRVHRRHDDCEAYQTIIDDNRFTAISSSFLNKAPKQYAVLVNISHDCGYVKADVGETIPRSNSLLSLDPNATSNISLVQSGRFHNMMNWLQKESYTQREPFFEKAYLKMLKKRYINGIIDCKGVLVFSRRRNK